jgi:hypothetical protein
MYLCPDASSSSSLKLLACFHHVWASFEGSAEVYNEVNRESATVEMIKTFFNSIAKVGKKMMLMVRLLF